MAIQLGGSSSSSSSSSSIHIWNHDVFLSFRGKDVRQKFISHLYQALRQNGINTYKDNVDLERGEPISSELFKAIVESRIAIIVFSENYAESKWCLDELLKILECKKLFKQIVLPVFYEVKPSDIREQKGSFGEAFTKLGKKIKDADIKQLESWKEALEEVAELSGLEYTAIGLDDESEFIESIIQWVNSRILNQTPLYVATYPIEIESRIRDIYQHLSLERNDIRRMVGIFGVGGIGKTTFAKDIYNRISDQFVGSCFLCNIKERSKREGLIELQKILLSEILGKKLDIYDADRGVNVIRERFRSKRVLLVLDDVDELDQLKKLAGDRAWFGLGSRIIVTTRDQQVLKFFEDDDSKYELKLWDDNEALQLFSLHAFKKDEPLDEYVELSKRVIKYAQGLPLALTVLGSDLKDQSRHQWKGALDKYESIPHRDIQGVLQISYDGLDDNEKEMFLDIAFFFNGEYLVDIKKIFDNYNFFPDDGIDRLIKKCLITIESGCVWMHDLLQDMGREIVRRESPLQPGERSRLWFHEDIRGVLEESMGTNKVAGMIIEMPKGEDAISLNSVAFSQMKRLRVLIVRNASFTSGPNYLSNELRVLDWFEYPLQSLPPNFHGKKLIIFRMSGHSLIKELSFIKCSIKFKDMTIMHFHDCDFLTKVPDLSSVPNLKDLEVDRCTRLVEVHDSVGSLENLSYLSFFDCSNLRIFPRSLKLRSLNLLDLGCCSSLRCFPEIMCEMKSLYALYIRGSAVEELPLSIGNLTGLEFLYLNNCKNLMRLPINIIPLLQHLREFGISGCANLLKKMGDDQQSILAIESPTMEDNTTLSEEQLQEILAPPTNSSNGSSELQVLHCRNSFQSELDFFPISSIFTESFSNFSATLTDLNLSGSQIVSLPTSIKEFVSVIVLDLSGCKKLEEISELPPKLELLFALNCQSLERFLELSSILEFNGSHNRSLNFIALKGCDKLHQKIWNYKVPNPLLWKGHYNATVLPENEIPEWFQHLKEFLENEIAQRGDDDVQLIKGNEDWVINIEGPHYLEDISGIVIYVVTFFNEDLRDEDFLSEAEVAFSVFLRAKYS
ncbi:hypothetical protein F2P56_013064 [Juglans regia]|uniref:ADP-ribosyl cyclase/cyclic ADP-ribose hydrolase n=1 Tax=Juglans regia TaxID=51240 RepID=A0A833XJS6_JUGRE|nr:hypothetical protein F2P56_013064 [Juglans regia]